MRSCLLGFVSGLVLGACSQPAPPASPAVDGQTYYAQDLETKTVALAKPVNGVPKAYCSGVWVSPSVFMTANHCVHGDNFYVTPHDALDALHAARVMAQDPAHDLALLASEGQTPPHGVAHVAFYSVVAGAKVATMSHPLGLWWSFSSGDVAAVREIDTGLEMVYIQTTAPVSGGSSGCGLFDAQGYLLGIGHAIAPEGSNLGFFVHTQYVKNLLRSNGLL